MSAVLFDLAQPWEPISVLSRLTCRGIFSTLSDGLKCYDRSGTVLADLTLAKSLADRLAALFQRGEGHYVVVLDKDHTEVYRTPVTG